MNLSVSYSPNRIILLFNIKHPYQMGRIWFSSLGTDPAVLVDGRKGEGRNGASCVAEMATAMLCSQGGCVSCSSHANARRGDANHPHSLPLQYICTWSVHVSLQTTILLFTCDDASHSAQLLCWCRSPASKDKTLIRLYSGFSFCQAMSGLLLIFLEVS